MDWAQCKCAVVKIANKVLPVVKSDCRGSFYTIPRSVITLLGFWSQMAWHSTCNPWRRPDREWTDAVVFNQQDTTESPRTFPNGQVTPPSGLSVPAGPGQICACVIHKGSLCDSALTLSKNAGHEVSHSHLHSQTGCLDPSSLGKGKELKSPF